MLVDNALVSLLKFHSRVTIPNLGSIIKQADFSHAVFFNQFIRFDDGLLRRHLEKVESCTAGEVEDEIDNFNARVNSGIVSTGYYEIPGLGYFIKQNGRMELVNDKKAFTPASHVQDDEPATQQDISKTHDRDTSFEKMEHPDFSDYTENVEPPNADPPYTFDEKIFDSKRTQSNESWPLVLALGGIVVILLLAALVYFGRRETLPAASDVQLTDSSLLQTDAQVVNATPEDTMKLANGAAPNAPPTQKDEDSYHIIVGSFKIESNADRFIARLNADGVLASKLGRQNDFYLVSFQQFDDIETAREKCTSARQQYEGAWLIAWHP